MLNAPLYALFTTYGQTADFPVFIRVTQKNNKNAPRSVQTTFTVSENWKIDFEMNAPEFVRIKDFDL